MIPLFLGLTAANLLALVVAGVLGYGVSSGRDWAAFHQLAGALAALTCVAVHCIVFSYFIATAKWIAHAVAVKKLDPRMILPTARFKARAFPAALAAMAIVFVTAVVGVATISYHISPTWHHGLAIASLAVNLLAPWIEYRAIAQNGELIDRILESPQESG